MQYFAAEKCEKLRQFLSLRGPTCHFGTPWFTEHLRAATERAIESVRNKIPFTDPIVEREDGEQVDLAEGMRQSDALVRMLPPLSTRQYDSCLFSTQAPFNADMSAVYQSRHH